MHVSLIAALTASPPRSAILALALVNYEDNTYKMLSGLIFITDGSKDGRTKYSRGHFFIDLFFFTNMLT